MWRQIFFLESTNISSGSTNVETNSGNWQWGYSAIWHICILLRDCMLCKNKFILSTLNSEHEVWRGRNNIRFVCQWRLWWDVPWLCRWRCWWSCWGLAARGSAWSRRLSTRASAWSSRTCTSADSGGSIRILKGKCRGCRMPRLCTIYPQNHCWLGSLISILVNFNWLYVV